MRNPFVLFLLHYAVVYQLGGKVVWSWAFSNVLAGNEYIRRNCRIDYPQSIIEPNAYDYVKLFFEIDVTLVYVYAAIFAVTLFVVLLFQGRGVLRLNNSALSLVFAGQSLPMIAWLFMSPSILKWLFGAAPHGACDFGSLNGVLRAAFMLLLSILFFIAVWLRPQVHRGAWLV